MATSPLEGGSRRRRRQARFALALAAVLAALALAIAMAVGGDDANESAGESPVRVQQAPDARRGADPLLAPGAGLETAPGIDLGGVDAFRLDFKKQPRAGLVFDLDSGEVLWRRHPLRVLPMASLTKIMTALLVVENTKPGERVLITREALRYEGSGVGVLPRGKRVPLVALMHGLLLPSGNDAAIALAQHVAGSERRFVRRMNRRARRMRLRCTHFASPHGLENRNRSCAADLAALSRIAMRKRRIASVARKRTAEFPFPIKGRRLYLSTTNRLLRERYPGTIGLKTGYTKKAGRCFVAIVRRGARTFGIVLLGSPNPARQVKKLVPVALRSR